MEQNQANSGEQLATSSQQAERARIEVERARIERIERARDNYSAAEEEAFDKLFEDIQQVRDELRAHARTLQQVVDQPSLTDLLAVAKRITATKTALSSAASRYFESASQAIDALLAAVVHRGGQPGPNQAQ